MGYISDRINRVILLGISAILWSAMTAISAVSTHFWLLVLTRICLGIFESAGNPAAYSLIADYFHPDFRGTANSIYTLGIYIGGALSSLTIVIITGIGWRWAFAIIGYIGMFAGLLCLLFVKEPQRGKFDKTKLQQIKTAVSPLKAFTSATAEIFVNPTCRWVVFAGVFRFFGGYAIGFYMPLYFGKIYPDDQTLYSYLNAFVVSFGGFISAYGGGILSDRLEVYSYKAKAYICIVGSFLGVPTIAVCTLYQKSFGVSITFLFFEYLVAECWNSPAITMLLNTVSPKNKGYAVSAYLFFTTISGTISTALCGTFQTAFDGNEYPERYGYILFGFVCFSYLGSIPFFYLSGNSYKAFKERQLLEEELAKE